MHSIHNFDARCRILAIKSNGWCRTLHAVVHKWCAGESRRGGANPIQELEKSSTAKGFTVAALAQRYVTEYVHSRHLRSAVRTESALKVHNVPSLGNELVDRLTREHVRALLTHSRDRIPNRNAGRGRRSQGGIEAARTAIVVLRAMLTWAIDEELVTRRDNPASKMVLHLPPNQRAMPSACIPN